MRLDKYLADAGMGTRTELKKMIRAGKVSLDGAVVRDPGIHVDAGSSVYCCGEPVRYEEYVYYMLNKPSGVISAGNDPREETVVDLINERKPRDLFPVGRLDRDTEGLLLITNDGELAHRLLSPRHHVSKIYYARVRGSITGETVQAFKDGMTLPGGLVCLPAELHILRSCAEGETSDIRSDLSFPEALTDAAILEQASSAGYRYIERAAVRAGTDITPFSEVLVTISEGKFHQIKRMFHAVGSEVLYLRRLAMGPLKLDGSLSEGSYRKLTPDEIEMLKKL